ncbi:hypothetical protein PFISCL1PPCAC_14845 [Pristionchus fissidentatus]|uniref:PDZ domain-containing protein n=1 Tax=Pristionchus fissidentatus TaxID=1538716 RepID=A0AAV5VZ88_9BILA|nr:hypothetical protein PFISCL1PPCAC_14845 [Pristionchus fissidentatus]
MLSFLLGFIFGIAVVIFVLYVIFFDPWGPPAAPHRFIDQFPPIQIPPELKRFLRTGEDGQGVSRWESCSSLSLLLHMLYQEHKDTRGLRRWLYKRLQVELNDVITRTPMGRFVQDIRILDLSLGTKFPVVNNIRVEKVEMSEDRESFEKIHFVIDLEYTGNFETSIGIWFLGKEGHLSLKVTRLAGLVRLCLSRKPYTHWSFCFVAEPLFDFDVTSQLNGHSLKRLIPVITQSIRHTMRRKFVSPNYKIRYRPLFPHPLLQPSPPPGAFSHIKMEGGLEVTVLQCTRLNTSVVSPSTTSTTEIQHEVYATVTLAYRPFIQSSSSSASHSFTCILHYSRYDPNAPIGLSFDKNAFNHGLRAVKVSDVTEGSLADKAHFKPGDILVAINNVPVRHERQVSRLMGTIGDLMILVERILEDGDEGGVDEDEVIIRGATDEGPDSEFVVLGEGGMGREEEAVIVNEGRRRTIQRSNSTHSDSLTRRHSLSQLPSSLAEETETSSLVADSLCSSLHDIANIPSTSRFSAGVVQRTESARVPHVLVSHPSVEIRRTRSDSQLNTSGGETKMCDEMLEEIFEKRVDKPIERASTAVDMRMEEMEGELREFDERSVDEMMDRRDESTLTPGKSLEPASSSASIASSSKLDDESVNQSENNSRFTRNRNGSKRQRLRDTLSAGKRRVFDLMPSATKRRTNANMIVDDVGVDALIDSLLQPPEGTSEANRHSPSPSGNGSSKTPPGSDKTKRSDRSKNDSSVPSSKGDTQSTPPSPSPSLPSSLSTRTVHLSPDVIWGQSLHFTLNNPAPPSTTTSKPPRFLNVTIHSREIRTREGEPAKPVLLGYTSLFIPQIVDDCQLTLSNAHREVFHLKPPSSSSVDSASSSPSLSSFAQHTGFDPRLCYGDVTLRFRYFPHGLPKGSGINPSCDQGEKEGVRRDGDGTRNETPPPTLPIGHQWKAISCTRTSAICAMCRGKIWTKAGTCCQKCLVVCHHKCAMKANSAICCTPTARSSGEDEELRKELFGDASTSREVEKEKKGSPATSDASSLKESPREEGENVSSIPIGEKTAQIVHYRGDTEVVSRRSKLRSKMSGVTEKWSHWRKKKNEKGDEENRDDIDTSSARLSNASMTDDTSSILSAIPIESELSDLLPTIEGSPHISEVYFQPGNAYNEETIANAKVLGKTIFGGVEPGERRIKINEQIDRIRDAITETKTARLWALQGGTPVSSPSTPSSASLSSLPSLSPRLSSLPFEALEQRMQALAVLMLHYCAALQDCNEESEGDVISMRSRGEVEERERKTQSTPSISPTPSQAIEACEEVMVEP